jgi:hypothetical protein
MRGAGFLVAVLVVGLLPFEAPAAGICDQLPSQIAWRKCMAKEVDRIVAAIDKKAFVTCSAKAKANGSQGPAAIDEGLVCRLQELSDILNRMD